MQAEPISNLNGGVEPTTLDAADQLAIVDKSDTTQAPTGTTKPVALSKLVTFFNSSLSFLSSVPSGKVGLADSNGVYTFYATLQLAINAASSGQTVELFSDITETTDTVVTLKDGVKINGNGHTYTLDFASATNAISATTPSGIYHLFNLNIKRVNSTSGSGLTTTANGIKMYGHNCYVESDGSGGAIALSGSGVYIQEFTARNIGTGAGIHIFASNNEVYKCIGFSDVSVGIFGNFGQLGIVKNCIGESNSSNGISAKAVYNSYGSSLGAGAGVYGNDEVSGCVGLSNSGAGISGSNNGNAYNSKGESNTGVGISIRNEIFNCTAMSNTNYGIFVDVFTPKISNCTIISASNIGLYINSNNAFTNEAFIANNYIESKLDAVGGHSLYFASSNTASSGNVRITNNSFKTKNAGANAVIYAGGGVVPTRTMDYANNTFSGMTVGVEAAITQGISNTSDSQGNIIT